jgi:hypothetical protein
MKKFLKKCLCGAVIVVFIQSIPVMAEEGYMCDPYYKDVQRKEKNIKDYGQDLSSIARVKLFEGLKFDTKQCISECEGQKFKYCNEIAKWISK